jgi:putative membrane protein
MAYFRIFLCGMVIGIANAIPGVSGGTMAVVLNVYDRLIALVSLNLKKILRDLPFALLLVAGAGTGIVLFAKLISGLFDSYPVPTTWFFMGLIVGSIPFVARRTRGTGSVPVKAVLATIAVVVMIITVFFRPDEGAGQAITALDPAVFLFLFLASVAAAAAMIVPGLSGSFVFLMLGAYRTVIRAVSDMNLPILLPVALGAGAGLLAGAALIRFFLARRLDMVYAVILGLVVGSLVPVFPGLPPTVPQGIVSAAVFAGGAVLSRLFSSTEKEGTLS